MTIQERYCRATEDGIKDHIAWFTPTCGAPVEVRAHDHKTPTLVVECATISDARQWSLAFLADLSHWREQDLPELGKHTVSSSVAWFGWHVVIHASEPLTVQVRAELVAVA